MSWKKEGPRGQGPKRRLTDGFHLQDIGRLQNTPARLAGPTQEILRKSEAHQMLAQSLGPRAQSFGPSGTKLGSPGHKAGVGSSHKSGFPRVLHLGGDIVLHELTRSRSYIVGWWVPTGTQGRIVGTCGTMQPNFEALLLSPTGPMLSCPAQYTLTLSTKCSPMASFINYEMAPWKIILLP